MSEKPWWKRLLPALVAFIVGALAGIGTMLGKSWLAGKAMQEAQAKDNEVLKTRLADQDKIAEANLAAVEANKKAAEEKAQHDHESRLRDIEANADAREELHLRNPDALPGSLVSTIERARRKLDEN